MVVLHVKWHALTAVLPIHHHCQWNYFESRAFACEYEK